METDTSWRSKAMGCLGGLVLGDAFGMPTEFMTPEQIKASYGYVQDLVSAPDWHPHGAMPPGSVTDDSGQALALVSAYRQQGRMTAAAAAAALLGWAAASGEQLSLVLGPSTRKALDALRSGMDPRQSGAAGTTNGAAMRVAPVGMVNAGNLAGAVADAVEASLPTHGTTLAISGAAAVACAVSAAMQERPTLGQILEAAAEGAIRGREHGRWVWTPPLEKRIRHAVALTLDSNNEADALRRLFELVGVDMLVVESIPTAFGLAALADLDPMRAIRYSANLGGDSDTIGAIAGAICGAASGYGALDKGTIDQVTRINQIDLAVAVDVLQHVREMMA